ncbi:hypothetical protein EC991_003675 [Linnemannia zychae]|nr:hypothetical protein EC991_003675 [Linnemannia zychae]
MTASVAATTITKSDQDVVPALTSTEPLTQQPPMTEEQEKTEPQSTEDDYHYTNDKQFQKFLRRFGGKRKGRK